MQLQINKHLDAARRKHDELIKMRKNRKWNDMIILLSYIMQKY